MMDKDEPFVYNEVDYKTPKQSPQTWPMDKIRQSRFQHKMSSLLSPVSNAKSLLLQCLWDAKSDPLPRRHFPVSCSDEGILMDGVLVTSATKKKVPVSPSSSLGGSARSSIFRSQHNKKNTELSSPESESGRNQETSRSQQSSSAGKGSPGTPKAANPSNLQASAEPFILKPRQASPFPLQQHPYNPQFPCAAHGNPIDDDPVEIEDAVPMEIDSAALVEIDSAVPIEIDPQSLYEVMNQLNITRISYIEDQLIRSVFGDVIYEKVCSQPSYQGHFIQADGKVTSLAWQTQFKSLLSDSSQCTNFGKIRDQSDHLLCWDYTATDLVSEANVRYGWEDKFHPLSAWHLCMACRPDLLGNDPNHDDLAKARHMCYSYDVASALFYMKYFGLPPIDDDREFDCSMIPIPSSKNIGRIESVVRFTCLEDAASYLEIGPLGADLVYYSKLFDKRCDIYRGPLEIGTSFGGYHAVIIESIREYRGDIVAVCRMSNGTSVGDNGYVYVSCTTMYMILDAHSTNQHMIRHMPEPQRLLTNFVGLRMVRKKKHVMKPASSSKPKEKEPEPEKKEDDYFKRNLSASSLQQQPCVQKAEPEHEYFMEKRNLEDMWKAAFLVGKEWDQQWDQQDALYEVKWNFKNVEEALEEGGKLHGKKVYVFGCTESQLVSHEHENKIVIVPTVVCIESTIPPSDKIGVASVQGKVEEIIPMKDMKMDWFLYPLVERDGQDDKMDFQIFILGRTQRRSDLNLLKEDRVKKFNYYFPYIDNPFKEDEYEQSTVVHITFPSEPPVVCEYDWAIDNLQELTDDLIKKETLVMDQKDEFNEFVKEQSDKAKTAYEEVKQARDKAKEGMNEETKEAYKEMKLYKFYPLPSPHTPDVAGINKSSVINKFLGKAHEVF